MAAPETGRHAAVRWLSRAAIVLAGLVAYANSFQGPFIFDDHPAITENPHIRHLWPLTEALGAPAQVAVTGRPVVSLSLALNYAVGGLNVWGYHAVNLAAHILAALVLFEIVRLTVPRIHIADRGELHASQETSADVGIALTSALLWVAHPLQTETVTYVSNRTELFMGLFYLLTIWSARKAFDSRGCVWPMSAIACCALGMGCKEVMASAPIMVALYDRLFLLGSWREALRSRIWLYLGLASTWILLAAIIMSEPRTHSVGFNLGVSPWHYLLTQAGVIVQYLRLSLWPSPLIIIYDWPIVTGLSKAIVPGAMVMVLLIASVRALFRRHWTGYLGAWFFIILAPSSSVIPLVTEIVAERRMYLPLASITVLAAAVAARILAEFQDARFRHSLTSALLVVVATALAAGTLRRNHDYRTDVAIWEDAVHKAPNAASAHNNLSVVLKRIGDPTRSESEVRTAIALKPDCPECHINLGILLDEAGHVASAIDEYREALRYDRNLAEALARLARLLADSGATDEPLELLNRAVAANPDHIQARMALGELLRSRGQNSDALVHFLVAQRMAPENPAIAANIGGLYALRGDLDRAVAAYTTAVALAPQDSTSRLALGDLLLRQDQPAQALVQLQEAARMQPDSVDARRKLGTALARLDRFEEALQQYQRVRELDGGSAESLNNIGTVEAKRGRLDAAIESFQQALLIDPGYDTARANLAEAHHARAITHANDGRMDQAIHDLMLAIDLATAANRPDAARAYQQRLDQYRNR